MNKGSEFIDIDDEKEMAGLETTSYEQIVLQQIKEAATTLSKPRRGGQVDIKIINGKKKVIEIPDTRETAIRTVNTLRSLLIPFIKNKLEDEFKEIDNKRKELKKELDNLLIKINNEEKKAKEFKFIPPNHPILKMRIEQECNIAEELFAVLVKAFHLSRVEIQQYETDK